MMTELTPTNGMTRSLKTEPALGNCYGDDNPDAWFPEAPQGSASEKKMQALGMSVTRAIILCKSCPRQAECLDEGMQPKNLSYGIWGGRLAGERLLLADALGIDYMTKRTGPTGSVIKASNSERVGKGRHAGSVVLNESEGVTVLEKRKAIGFLRIIKPWIKG